MLTGIPQGAHRAGVYAWYKDDAAQSGDLLRRVNGRHKAGNAMDDAAGPRPDVENGCKW
jgi:hypothetical protein